jgi:hypothetical protein
LTAAWWTPRRIKHLQQMAGAVGREPGEPPIASMGSTGPPHVEQPYFIRDRLVCDGAQVTRPSIDPYREPVETHIYLFRGRVRLSMPVVVKLSPEADPAYFRAAVKACYCMNVLADVGSHLPDGLEKYGGGLLADVGLRGRAHFAAHVAALGEDAEVVRIPPSEEFKGLEAVLRRGVWGVYVDEDLGGGAELEVAVSLLDKMLRRLGLRNDVSVIAGGPTVRGSDDIYKLVALGADAVAASKAVEIAAGLPGARAGEDVFRERVENLLLGFQRELKLLAGAAGVSSFFNSLVGSRELMRAVELDRAVRMKLGVKQAGV